MKPTTIPIARFLLALLLFAAGLACWMAAGVADDLAAGHERWATLQNRGVTPPGRARALVERLLDTNRPYGTATALVDEYWAGRYERAGATGTADADGAGALLLGANALFRRAQRDAAGRTPAVERLDQVAQAYAGVLKNASFDRDAAYNYEFVARMRDSVAKSKGAAPSRLARTPAPQPGDALPSGPTIHGRRGTHPPNTRGEDFEVLTPMDYGDREAQPEATPGRPLPKKG
jgi:hypothetical protein